MPFPRVNIPVFMLSLLISASAWFILNGQNLMVNRNLPVRLTKANISGLPKNLHVDDISRVTLHLEGPTGKVEDIYRDAHLAESLSVDLSEAKAGVQDYPITLPASIADVIQGGKTPVVRITLEDIVSNTVPVKILATGRLKDPTSFLTWKKPEPRLVVVTGPKSVIDKVTSACAYPELSKINIPAPEPQPYSLVAVGADNQKFPDVDLDPREAKLSPIIEAQASKAAIVSEQLVGDPAPGYVVTNIKINPTQVQITGPSSKLVDVSSVKTEQVDISGLTETKLFDVGMIIPRGISSKTEKVYVRVTIERDPGLRSGKSTIPLPRITPLTTVPLAPKLGAGP